MKIGIVSDTHGSITAWQKAFSLLNDSQLIIHCGDVLYHGPRNPLPDGYQPQELVTALNAMTIPMVYSKGNCDAEVDQMLLEYPIEAPYVHLVIDGIRILVHHGHQFDGETVPAKLLRDNRLIISGHTHLPGIHQKDLTVFLNPGSPALPKNSPKVPTVAQIIDRRIEILNLVDGSVVQSISL
jgi:uncharacterized protein